MNKMILFLIRKKLGLSKYRCFRFTNQKSKVNEYFFDNDALYKIVNDAKNPYVKMSNVSLNYLISGRCSVEECNHLCIGSKSKGFAAYATSEIGE